LSGSNTGQHRPRGTRSRYGHSTATHNVVQVGDGADWREVLLEALRVGFSVTDSCRAADVSRTLAYRERGRSREFRSAWKLALQAWEGRLGEQFEIDTVTALLAKARTAGRMAIAAEGSWSGPRRARLQVRLRQSELDAWQQAAAGARLSVLGLVRRLASSGLSSLEASSELAYRSWQSPFIEALRRSGMVAAAPYLLPCGHG
jgi:hypothetical protein